MRIAFDYGGVLQTHRWCREMAKALIKAGHDVYCISAVPNSWRGNDRRVKEVKALRIPFKDIFITYHDVVSETPEGGATVTHEQAWAAGVEKAKVMKDNKIDILIDDLPQIILAVREAGFIGLHLG